VSYLQLSGQSRLVVSSTGLITSVSALPQGVYAVSGSTSDTTGDVGLFTFTLTVTASGTTSTTTSTTTTTVPLANPIALRAIGHASAGRSAVITIVGSGFYGRPTITSHHGTAVIVTRDTGRRIDAIVIVSPRSRNGTFTFTMRFARGEHCQVRYVQR
jgi:flagellar capping protein FliD